MQHSLRRLAIGAVLAGATFAAAPAIASASSSCTFDTASHQMVIQDGSGSGQLVLSRSGEYLTYADDWGAPQLCVKGTAIASIRTTDTIYVQGPLVGAGDGYFVDESSGRFAPGLTPEATGTSEIELDFNPSGSVKPVITVRGTEQADHVIVAGKGQVDLNGDLDADLSVDAASLLDGAGRVIVYGGAGNDNLDGSGFGLVGPAVVPETLHGGNDNDDLTGGRERDELDGEAGIDDISAYFDGYPDVINGGSEFDTAYTDSFDTADVERNVVIRHP